MPNAPQMDVPDEDRPSNTLELFAELAEVLDLIASLPQTVETGAFEKSYETFSERVGRYQEQPHLLDPHLDQLLTNLLAYIRDPATPAALSHAAFKYMYQLSKVRTFKVLVKFLPHEIADLEFVLSRLERQSNAGNAEQWESRYMLVLWLSILVLNPFEMARLDGDRQTSSSAGCDTDRPLTTAERIYRVCQTQTNSNDTCATVAAFLVSKYLIRVDIKDQYLPAFFTWIRDAHPVDSSGVRTGQLDAIAAILKHGKREDLLVHIDELLGWVLGCNYKELGDYLKSKLFVKIVQRVGLVLLKPRLALWRYQRGQRSLTVNLATGAGAVAMQSGATVGEDDSDENIQVPDSIEDVIEELLQSLRSPSSAIRWSAAKGIGRVTSRLPRTLGDEVVGTVVELLNPLEPHEAWHGGCLAIAELSKRGLLLPYRLEAIVPILQQALIYDEMKGYMSVGQHIRDAACYVAWAFARAYEPDVLKPFVVRLANALLVTTVFDREINCRRAASAAFQESVGRLGNFPHGIDILTAADFYSVGVRSNAYLHISVFIAQFNEYRHTLIGHLVQQKIGHWDTAIRELAAKTMGRLTVCEPRYMAAYLLKILVECTDSIDVHMRHGSVLAIGEIVRALKAIDDAAPPIDPATGGCEREQTLVTVSGDYERERTPETVWLTTKRLLWIDELLMKFLKRDQFRGMSGDIMRHCCCDFIRNCSLARIDTSLECLHTWQTIIDGCITRKSAQLRECAVEALATMTEAYYARLTPIQNTAMVHRYLLNSCESLEENIRMGSVSAVGALPAFMLRPCRVELMDTLIMQSVKASVRGADAQTQLTLTWAESRRDSVRAIGRVVATFGYGAAEDREQGDGAQELDKVFACLLQALLEYTLDDRGDIGAWVREAAMNELYTLVTKCPPSALKPDTMHAIMTGFCQQATEIIDRTRGLAGSLFCKLIHHDPVIPHIPRHKELLDIFPADTTDVLWIYADHTFPLFCAMLSLPEYSPRLLVGLSASMGKLSESLVKHASAALFQFLRAHPNEVKRLCAEVVTIFAANVQNDPISHPLLNFLDALMASGTVNAELFDPESNFADEIYRLTKLEHKGQRKLYKLVSSINVFCQLMQLPRLCPKVLSTLAIYLGLMHVHVRKCTATKLYEAIVIHGDTCGIPEENIDEILELLSETDWGLPLVEIRPIRNHLCTLLGIKPPVSLAADAAKN